MYQKSSRHVFQPEFKLYDILTMLQLSQ